MKKISLIIALLFATCLVAGYRDITLAFEDSIALSDSFIIAESETLRCGNAILPTNVYNIDYSCGIIVFTEPTDCDSLVISYRYVELDVPSIVQHRVPRGSGGQLALKPEPTKNLGMFPGGSRLVHSGSLLRGVKIGSRRDATVESAFQLEAYGAIGEDVEITATLSDQDLPIQPEGTSEKIAQLDQVFINVTALHFGATFGDFTAEFTPDAEFTNYSRRLSGVQIGGYSNLVSAEAAGAVLEGIWATDDLYGIEGNQGPYSLSGDGKSPIQILAGTETVWLDGEKLRRGADNDYTIDYNLGQITFTTNRPIAAQSRIVADFQYTDLEYRRSFYGVNGKLIPRDNIHFYFAGMTELDDPDNPLNYDFSEDELAAIISAGDLIDSAYVWGAVLSDSGDYILADSATDSAHFEWVGESEGTWDVVFSNVGSGNGEYSYTGGGIYEWVGPDSGSYTPRRILPLPAGHSVMDAGLTFVPFGGTTLSTEVAASNLDGNRLSDISDNDNTGGAVDIKLQSSNDLSIRGNNFGNIGLDGEFRRKEARFAAIGRLDDAEFQRDWGIESASGAEQLAQIGLNYSPLTALKFSGAYGANEIGEQKSTRITSAVDYDTEPVDASVNFSRTQSPTRWDKLWGDLSAKLWMISPSVDWRYEDNEKASGFRFWQGALGLGIAPTDWLSMTPSIEQREDETYDSTGSSTQLTARTTSYKLSGAIAQWDFTINHREYQDLSAGSGDIITDLAKVNGAFKTSIPNTNGRLRYELSRNRSEVLEPYYTYVGMGVGNYEFDEDRGEFIASAGGDYLKEYLSTNEFTPVVSSNFRANLSIKPGRIKRDGAIIDFIKELSADGLLQAEAQTEASGTKSLLLDPRNMNEDADLVSGRFVAEGSAKYGAGVRGITLRRRFSKYRSTQYTTGEELRWDNRYSAEGRLSFLSAGNFRGKIEWTWQARLYPGSSRTGTDLNGTEFALLWTRSLTDEIQATNDLSYLTQTDDWPDEPVSIERYAVSPSFTYFLTKGTVRGALSYSRVESDDEAGILPYDMAKGDYIGDNGTASLTVDVNIASGTVLTVAYNLESHSGRTPEHTAEAKVRLTF